VCFAITLRLGKNGLRTKPWGIACEFCFIMLVEREFQRTLYEDVCPPNSETIKS
jgi:hypothetical protein